MTNEQLDHAIAILKAKRDGKVIEYWNSVIEKWVTSKAVIPECTRHEYRIKPEPRVWYADEYDGLIVGLHIYEKTAFAALANSGRIIRVIEDLSYSPEGEV